MCQGDDVLMAPAAFDLLGSAREPGRECGFLVLLAFLASFSFIRTSARLMRSPRVPWWPGSVEAGGVHIHHLVWGISLLLVSRLRGIRQRSLRALVADHVDRLRNRLRA